MSDDRIGEFVSQQCREYEARISASDLIHSMADLHQCMVVASKFVRGVQIGGCSYPAERLLPIEIVVQHHFGVKGLKISDIELYAHILALAQRGHIKIAKLSAGETPHANMEAAENNSVLERLCGFMKNDYGVQLRAEFLGPPQGEDGFISFDKPLEAQYFNVEVGKWQTASIRPQRLSLEVGTVNAKTTFTRLVRSQGIARWPYGHKTVTILSLSAEATLELRCWDRY